MKRAERFSFVPLLIYLIVGCTLVDSVGSEFVFLGCSVVFSVSSVDNYVPKLLTPWVCVEYCRQHGNFEVIGLQGGDTCACGLPFGSRFSLDDCSVPCTGDYHQNCGGLFSWAVYRNVSEHSRNSTYWEFHTPRNAPVDESTPITPHPRAGHSVLKYQESLVLFGGFVTSQRHPSIGNTTLTNATKTNTTTAPVSTSVRRFNDVWLFDTTTDLWSLVGSCDVNATDCPTRRSSAAAGMLTDSQMVIQGGYRNGGACLPDLWIFDFILSEWSLEDPGLGSDDTLIFPEPRGDHTLIVYNGDIVLFGGVSQVAFFGDTWRYSFTSKTWRLLAGPGPESTNPAARAGHSSFLLPGSQQTWLSNTLTLDPSQKLYDFMILTMGRSEPSFTCFFERNFKDVWAFNLETNTWIPLNMGTSPWDLVNKRWATPSPPKRYAQALGNSQEYFLVHGGSQEFGKYDDAWYYDFKSNEWNPVQFSRNSVIPSARDSHAGVYMKPDEFAMFGGQNENSVYFGDIWVLKHEALAIPSVDKGQFGLYVVAALGGVWGVFALVMTAIYCPRKYKHMAQQKLASKSVQDFDVFHVDKKAAKMEKKMNKQLSSTILELSEMISEKQNYFDRLPDELLLAIFTFLTAFDIAKTAQVCTRFYKLTNDEMYWRGVVKKHWKDKPKEQEENNNEISLTRSRSRSRASKALASEEIPPSKSLYLTKFQYFQSLKKEKEISGVLSMFKTTLLYYGLLLLLMAQMVMIGLKLDGYFLQLQWFVVFTPFWVFDVFLLCCFVLILHGRYTVDMEFANSFEQIFPFLKSLVNFVGLLIVILATVIFSFLFVLKLDRIPPFADFSWWIVISPFLLNASIACVVPYVRMIRVKGCRWSLVWVSLSLLCYIATVVLIAARLEGNIVVDWCLVFLPWWISDLITLICAISFCAELRNQKLGWMVSTLFVSYLLSNLSQRSLLCVNLGQSCGDPTAYSWTLLTLPVHLFVFLFGVPLIVMARVARPQM